MKYSALTLGLLALSLTGCGDLVEQLEKKLGVAVVVEGGQLGSCAGAQAEQFLADYRALTKAKRKQVRDSIRARYKQIVVKRTAISQITRGEATSLAYVVRDCSSGTCDDRRVTAKRLDGNTTVEGTAPITQVERVNERLTIQAQGARDESLRKHYFTQSVDIYDQADSATDEDFIRERQRGNIYLDREVAQPTETCGARISLAELVK